MIAHYLKVAVRNLLKNKTQSIISLLGLTVGFVCFSLASIWIHYEMTYDTFHKDAEQIYFVCVKDKKGFYANGISIYTPYVLANYLKENFAEVKEACAVEGGNRAADFIIDENSYKLNMLSIDSMAFNVFDIKILEGSDEFLNLNSGKIAITRRASQRIFGNESPIGKEIFSIYSKNRPFKICAVVSEWPEHSNLNYDIINRCYPNDRWGSFGWQTFVRLHNNASVDNFTRKIEELSIDKNHLDGFLTTPITRLRYNYPLVNLDIKFQHVVLFAIASALVILCCLLNYMNLFICQIRTRSKEFALRMVNGASSFRLFTMLIIEYSMLLFMAWLFSMLFIELLQPYFKEVCEIKLTKMEIYKQGMVCGWGIILLSVLPAAIPILYYRKQSVQSIITIHKNGKEKNLFRRAMLLSQFIISIGFIFCVSVITKQLYFLNYSDVGMERKNRATLVTGSFNDNQAIVERIKQLPEIEEVLSVNNPLIPRQGMLSMTYKDWEDKANDAENVDIEIIEESDAFMKFYGMKLLEGEMLTPESADTDMVLNEAAVKALGWHNAVGKHLYNFNTKIRIIGVVKNWHITSPTAPIRPIGFKLSDKNQGYATFGINLLIKYKEGTWEICREKIRMIADELFPENRNELTNIEEEYNKFLSSENALLRLLSILALVCILISIFGIYSQILLACKQRRKEIAIRKINGANVKNILYMFSQEYFWLLMIASIIAFTVSYAIMKHWLENYTLQTTINWWIFAIIFIGIFFVIAITIGYRVWKAANENPADVVKSE